MARWISQIREVYREPGSGCCRVGRCSRRFGPYGGFSWLTNAVPAEEAIPARLLIFCAMAAMFVASLAVPGAFGRYGVIFGVVYFVVQLQHPAS